MIGFLVDGFALGGVNRLQVSPKQALKESCFPQSTLTNDLKFVKVK
jgi:hypothetical protein